MPILQVVNRGYENRSATIVTTNGCSTPR